MEKQRIGQGLFCALLVMGCAAQELGPVYQTDMRLTVKLYETAERLNAAYTNKRGMADYRKHAYGFAIVSNGRCELHLLRLRSKQGMRDWGHELSHCVYGQWHKKE